MPVSRGRKKKAKSKKLKVYTRTFEQDGIKISQKGNMTYIENKRTEKQQEEFIAHVKENRPAFFEELKLQIQDVIDDIQQYDKLTLMGGISSLSITQQFIDDGKGEVTLEYAQSICLATPNANFQTQPTPADVQRIIRKLVEIRTGFSQYYGSEQIAGKFSEIESAIRFPMMLESLFVRGDGYIQHLYEVFTELFSPHDDFLVEKYGFKALDVIETFKQLEDSFCTRIIYPNRTFHPAHRMRWERWKQATSEQAVRRRGITPMEAFAQDNPDLIFENGKPKFFWVDHLPSVEQIFRIRYRYPEHEKVVKALSKSFGDNEGFLNPAFRAEPLNDSAIFTHPIVQQNENYYLFGFNIAARNLIKIGENLLKTADKKYYTSHFLGNKYYSSRDNYLEKKVEKLFKGFLPQVDFYPGVSYALLAEEGIEPTGDNVLVNTELDLLGVGMDATYLIEIKAGQLNDSARRGAIKSITNTLKETVGYAAFQSYRAEQFIAKNENPIFFDKKRQSIVVDKTKKIYRISISLDHIGGLTNLYDLKELDIISNDIDFAWSISLYDLMIFSEIIQNEKDFQDYLSQRIVLYQRQSIQIPDEISLLGWFLKEGNIKFEDKKLGKLDTFRFEQNYASEIDDYFHKKLFGIPTTLPNRKK